MNQSTKNKVHYDKKYDVLNVKFNNTNNSYGDEDIDNIVMLKDIESDEITGITILDFKKMFDNNDKRMGEISKYIDAAMIYSKYVSVL